MEKRFIEDHEKKECRERKEICQFCRIDKPYKEMAEHEEYCGSRTEPCDDCGRYVMMKDALTHQCDSARSRSCRYCDVRMGEDVIGAHEDQCGTRTEFCDKCTQPVMLKEKSIHQSTNCRGLLTRRRDERRAAAPAAAITVDVQIDPSASRRRRQEKKRLTTVPHQLKKVPSPPPPSPPPQQTTLPLDYLQPTRQSAFHSQNDDDDDDDDDDDELPWIVNGGGDVSAEPPPPAPVTAAVSKTTRDPFEKRADLGGGLEITKSFIAPPGTDLNQLVEEHLKCEEELEKRKKQSQFGKKGRGERRKRPDEEKTVDLKQMEEDHRLAEALQRESILSTSYLDELGENRLEQEREFQRFEEERRAAKAYEEETAETAAADQLEKLRQEAEDLALAQQLQEEEKRGRLGGLYRLSDDDDELGSGDGAGILNNHWSSRRETTDDCKKKIKLSYSHLLF